VAADVVERVDCVFPVANDNQTLRADGEQEIIPGARNPRLVVDKKPLGSPALTSWSTVWRRAMMFDP
jgi:hypothetical protein